MKKKKFSEIIKECDEKELILEHEGVIERAKNELVQTILDNDDSLTLDTLMKMKGKVLVDARILGLFIRSLLTSLPGDHADTPIPKHSVQFVFSNLFASELFTELAKRLNSRGIQSINKNNTLYVVQIGRS